MVMINTTIQEMNALLKKSLSRKDYTDLCFRYGMDLEGDGDYLNFEVTSDRVEIVSKFSLAYLLGRLIGISVHRDEGIPSRKENVSIKNTHRPFVNLLHLKMQEPVGKELGELLVIQDKLDKTIGRDRSAAAIGMFDYSRISSPLTYGEVGKEKVSFKPLGSPLKLDYEEITSATEKGIAYGALLKEKPIVWTQKDGEIFAMPPIINADFASISKDTKSILVDITGNNRNAVNSITKALIFNLQFLGEVSVIKPRYEKKQLDAGLELKNPAFFLEESNISNLIGIELSIKDVTKILKAMDYEIREEKGGLQVSPPFYRQDVIHQVDIVDDVLRFYGVDRIKEGRPHSYTSGARVAGSDRIGNIIDILLGFGYQELDLNVLTNEVNQFTKTGIDASDYAPLLGIKSGAITMARSNLSGEMLRFVSNNLHKKFPQKLFDIGFVMKKADNDVAFANSQRLCVCSCSQESNISEIRVILEKLLRDTFDSADVSVRRDDNIDGFDKMFITGRGGLVYYGGKKIGVIGEIHPRALNEFGIELPVSMAEIYLDELGL